MLEGSSHNHLCCNFSMVISILFNDMYRKTKGGFTPAFAPIGQRLTNQNSATMSHDDTPKVKRSAASEESHAKITAKKAKLAKFGLKFQSAGTLTSITDQLGSDTSTYRPPAVVQRLTGGNKEQDSGQTFRSSAAPTSEHSVSGDKKLSFELKTKSTSLKPVAFQSKDISYTSVWDRSKPGAQIPDNHLQDRLKGPPPLMSRQRELNMEKAFGDDSSDEEDIGGKLLVKRGPAKFKFNIRK